MIVLIAGEKGGSGKSTVATNIAVGLAEAGRDVLLLDADRQRTAANWCDRRQESGFLPAINCAEKTGDIKPTIADLGGRYGDIVIDAGGRDSRELRAGLLVADVVYVPVRPSQADLETTPHIAELVGFARASRLDGGPRTFLLLSMAPTHHLVTEAEEAREVLADLDELELAPVVIRERKAYRDALAAGQGVTEGDNASAREEIKALMEHLKNV